MSPDSPPLSGDNYYRGKFLIINLIVMRQLKNLMKAKKPMWRCGECKCVTLQCWRNNDEFCNCGDATI
jgi:hypothetical protein